MVINLKQYDGKGNPKQYVTHFIKIRNNVGTYDDLLVKKFMQSLIGNAFDEYTDLESRTNCSWGQLEQRIYESLLPHSLSYKSGKTDKLPLLGRRTYDFIMSTGEDIRIKTTETI